MSKKVIPIIVCLVSIIVMITYTIFQLTGDWRGNISIYVVGIVAVFISLSDIINQKKISEVVYWIGIILAGLFFVFIIGGCIFLYLFNQS